MSYKLLKPYNVKQRRDFIKQYERNMGLAIEETSLALYALEPNEIMVGGFPQVDPDWEEKKAQKEKERINELFMTRSDFFDCTIRAWRLREKELLVLIENLLATLPVDEVDKLVAINNFENAQNFYRKHTLFSMIVIAPLKLSETTQVIITDADLDKLFDEVDKGNKATAWQYLPQPTLIPIEPSVEEETDQTEDNLDMVGNEDITAVEGST